LRLVSCPSLERRLEWLISCVGPGLLAAGALLTAGVEARQAWSAAGSTVTGVDIYQPSEQFAAFLEEEQTRIKSILKDLGLTQ
jgi:hypothetical protein